MNTLQLTDLEVSYLLDLVKDSEKIMKVSQQELNMLKEGLELKISDLQVWLEEKQLFTWQSDTIASTQKDISNCETLLKRIEKRIV